MSLLECPYFRLRQQLGDQESQGDESTTEISPFFSNHPVRMLQFSAEPLGRPFPKPPRQHCDGSITAEQRNGGDVPTWVARQGLLLQRGEAYHRRLSSSPPPSQPAPSQLLTQSATSNLSRLGAYTSIMYIWGPVLQFNYFIRPTPPFPWTDPSIVYGRDSPSLQWPGSCTHAYSQFRGRCRDRHVGRDTV